MEEVIETLLGMEIVDESDAIEDLRGAARRKWTERAKKLGLELPSKASVGASSDGPTMQAEDKPDAT